MKSDKNEIIYDLGVVLGGINNNDPSNSLLKNQVVYSSNWILKQKGFKRFPGVENLTAKHAINNYLRGMHIYPETDGTEHLLEVHGGKLYEVNKSTGDLTELYNMTGSGEAWFCNYWGKCFLTNGTKVIKVENSTAYQVGIDAPTTGTAAAVAGGSLPDGIYKVYIGYARKVSGVNVLYSSGKDLGSVECKDGANTVRILSFGNSSDPQVNNKIVWMTDAGGSIYYFYHKT
jgi:hypothetical protein